MVAASRASYKADLDLLRLLNHGYLPRIYNAADPRPLLDAYVSQYLKEEVAAVFHELCCYNSYRARYADFFYWRLSSGIEVDFLVNHIDCAIKAKASSRIRADHTKGLRELSVDHPETKRRLVVSLDPHDRTTDDGIELLHYSTFIAELWQGAFF